MTNVLQNLSISVGPDNDTFKYIAVAASQATSFVQTVKGLLLTLERDTMSGIKFNAGSVPEKVTDPLKPILKLAFKVKSDGTPGITDAATTAAVVAVANDNIDVLRGKAIASVATNPFFGNVADIKASVGKFAKSLHTDAGPGAAAAPAFSADDGSRAAGYAVEFTKLYLQAVAVRMGAYVSGQLTTYTAANMKTKAGFIALGGRKRRSTKKTSSKKKSASSKKKAAPRKKKTTPRKKKTTSRK